MCIQMIVDPFVVCIRIKYIHIRIYHIDYTYHTNYLPTYQEKGVETKIFKFNVDQLQIQVLRRICSKELIAYITLTIVSNNKCQLLLAKNMIVIFLKYFRWSLTNINVHDCEVR